MFDFQKLDAYNKAKTINRRILDFLRNNKDIDIIIRNQLKRASISSVLNIAEGAGRFTKADKRNFYIISRGSVYECVALFDILSDDLKISLEMHNSFYMSYEEMSKILFGLIKSLE